MAESHQHLSKESLAGNKPANAVLHKVNILFEGKWLTKARLSLYFHYQDVVTIEKQEIIHFSSIT